MAIYVNCSKCGKRIGVVDALAGKSIKCPQCAASVPVPAAAGAPKPGAAAAKGKPKVAAGPALSISPGILIGGGVGALLLIVVLSLYFGPWRVGNEWAAMSSRANDDVTDVVMFALQAHQSAGLAGLNGSDGGPAMAMAMGKAPAIEGPAVFVPPMMAFSMPRKLLVSGATSQGKYIGTYDTTNGEVDVNLDVGGYTVGGLVAMRKATGTLHVTGREKDGVVSAEADGTPMKIITPKMYDHNGNLLK